MKVFNNIEDFKKELFSYADNHKDRIEHIQVFGVQGEQVAELIYNTFGVKTSTPKGELYLAFDKDLRIIFEKDVNRVLISDFKWYYIVRTALYECKEHISNWQDWSFYDDYLNR